MTVVAPGSAQLVAGNRRVGRAALRTYCAVLALCTAATVLGLSRPSTLISVLTRGWVLVTLRVMLIALALAWAWLIVDSWRLADPLALTRTQRLALTVVNGVACFSTTGALLFGSHLVAVQRDFIATVFGGNVVSQAQDGRYNVLLLGGDAGPGRVGVRPDSITVASIDALTGRTVLFGLPRNLADAPFKPGSVMDAHFPNGFSCDGCYLNGVNTWATEHADLFPGVAHPGIEATRQSVEQITGLTVNYYALIDLRGFQDLVDAVGGVTIKVSERIPIGKTGDITGWIEPGTRHLDGFDTLWYARSRATSDDYSRMARQKCVMSAMLHQLDPKTVITNFGDIAAAGKRVISTSIPASELGTFVGLALKAKSLPISTVSFVPPRIDTGDPDWNLIRTMVTQAVSAAEARDDTGPVSRSATHPHHRDANHSADLAAAC